MDPYKGTKLNWLQKSSLKDPVLILVTFPPVVKATIIRIILALAVHYNWPLRQVDINNAFLHGDLIELVFMQQPPGFENATTPTYVCKLNKALYDLKQAPRAWFAKLTSTLTMWDFTISKSDSSLMIYASKDNLIFLLINLCWWHSCHRQQQSTYFNMSAWWTKLVNINTDYVGFHNI